MGSLVLVAFSALLFSLMPLCKAMNYYIKPTDPMNVTCPGDFPYNNCHTFQEYIERHEFSDTTWAKFYFLSGTHYFSKSLHVTGALDLHLLRYNDNSPVTLCASSDSNTDITFYYVERLTLDGLEFTDCQSSQEPRLSVMFESVSDLAISNVLVANQMASFVFNNVVKRAEISSLIFHHVVPSYGPMIVAVNYNEVDELGRNKVIFSKLQLKYCTGGIGYVRNISLQKVHVDLVFQSLMIESTKPADMESSIVNFLSVGYKDLSSITITNSTIAGILISSLPAYGGIFIRHCLSSMIKISNTTISQWKSGITLTEECSEGSVTETDNVIMISNVHFEGNSAAILQWATKANKSASSVVHAQLTLTNSFFERNGFMENGTLVTYVSRNVTIHNCTFSNNAYTPLIAYASTLYFYGNISFINNTGSQGGAIALLESLGQQSLMWVTDASNTNILFMNNFAGVGGAIYVSEKPPKAPTTSDISPCFLQIPQESSANSQKIIKFYDNKAYGGGDAIFGGEISLPCSDPDQQKVELLDMIRNISDFKPSTGLSTFSSNPIAVCFCNKNLINCSSKTQERIVYSGQTFSVEVALIGNGGGTVKGPIYAELYPVLPGVLSGAQLHELQYVQESEITNCTSLTYTIFSAPTELKLQLSPNILHMDSNSTASTTNIYLSVHPCPLGFDNDTDHDEDSSWPTCVCEAKLKDINVICNITNQTIQRTGTVWVGTLNTGKDGPSVVYSTDCPFHYCIESLVSIKVNNTGMNESAQCNSNRTGILCGSCKHNFSLALGSKRCLGNCSNWYLLQLIVSAIAGVALVLLLRIFNLTVSEGVINGLIFYANIIGTATSAFFPLGSDRVGFTAFSWVFLSWVNLNYGIEACFYNGMDAYAKAWLEFVFPTYLLLLTLGIIVLSHYSQYAAKILGDKSVPVLATLILLSYTKILQAIITGALDAKFIFFTNGTQLTIWKEDGNIEYFQGKQIYLSVFALVILLFFWIPFTILLLLSQCFQKLRCTSKFMPFFDAFTGPFKTKHRYWVGALLLVRCVLPIFTLVNANSVHSSELVAVVFIAMALLLYLSIVGQVYRHFHLGILECSYIFNLGCLAAGTLYTQSIGGNQEALIGTSVGIAFFTFLATAFIQVIRKPLRRFIEWNQEKKRNDTVLLARPGSSIQSSNEYPYTEYENLDYRESMFKYLDEASVN